MVPCNLKQHFKTYYIRIIERVISPTDPSFNTPSWCVLKPGKNEWWLVVNNCNFNAVVPSIKTPISNTQYYRNY